MDTETIVSFEVAREVLNNMIAIVIAELRAESARATPNQDALKAIAQKSRTLHLERKELELRDSAAIKKIIETYGPVIKASVACHAPNRRPPT